MTHATKHHSDVKYARIDRKHVCNGTGFHQAKLREFNKAERKASKLALKSHY